MRRLALAALTAIATILPLQVWAQGTQTSQDPQDVSYREKREQLIKELEQTQKSLSDLKGERAQLSARIDNVMARLAQQRALALTLSSEQNALVQLDSVLTGAQDVLASQHDRLASLGDALRQSQGGMLVVIFRADSATGTMGNASLAIDGAAPVQRSYSSTAAGALRLGAVDEVFRGTVLPMAHKVAFTVDVNGAPVTNTVDVATAGDAVTYVQFALRNGQLVPTTWTSRGTTPF